MIIDAHHHLWHYHSDKHQWIDDSMQVLKRDFTGSQFSEVLTKNNISGSVLVQVDQTEQETIWLLEQAENHPFILGVVGWVDLMSDDLKSKLAVLSGYSKLKGFRHIVQSERYEFMLQPEFQTGVGQLEQFGFSYDILIYHHQLTPAIELVRKFPNQLFVLDHIAKPDIKSGSLESWATGILELSDSPNVVCKLSGMITEANHSRWTYDQLTPFLDQVFESFGVERLMFGSDWPVCLLAGSYNEVLEIIEQYISGFSDAEKSKILYENARKFYNL